MSDDPLLARLQRLAEDLPGVETGTSYGTPALKVAGKLFVRIKDAETLVLMVRLDDKERLIERTPTLYTKPTITATGPPFWCTQPPSMMRNFGTAWPKPGISRPRRNCASNAAELPFHRLTGPRREG